MSLILVVEVNAEVLLASALASEITATTFVAIEATTLVAFLETLSVALATEVTATLAVALEAAAATLVIVVIVAAVVEEMGMEDKTVGVCPVGCAVFAYRYLDIDWQEAAHGRAPAVATGIKRLWPDRLVFTYQGDGDLACIGTCETIHALNRGEHIAIIFINNAIYGMTGGQMAPTTLLGQKTATCPYGREADLHGYPLNITELASHLQGTCYVTRQSVETVASIKKAKKAKIGRAHV